MNSHLSLRACAEDLGVAHSTLWRAVQRGNLPALRIGRVFRVEAKEWAAFKERLNFYPPMQPPAITARVHGNLIDRVKSTH